MLGLVVECVLFNSEFHLTTAAPKMPTTCYEWKNLLT